MLEVFLLLGLMRFCRGDVEATVKLISSSNEIKHEQDDNIWALLLKVLQTIQG
jgi:hypothetical protein